MYQIFMQKKYTKQSLYTVNYTQNSSEQSFISWELCCGSFFLCLCLLLTMFPGNLNTPLCAVVGSWRRLCCEGSKLSALLLEPRLQTMGQTFGFPQCPEENSAGEHQLQDVVLSCHARGPSLCQWEPGHYMQSVQDIQKEQFQFGLQCHAVQK